MNLITGRAGAAHITPRQDAMWHQGLIEMESCIFDAYENFAAEIITNNEVRIRSGVGMLQGRFFCIEPNTYDSAEIANGNQGEERIDLIVARIAVDASANTQSASIEVIQGTPAAENPTTPEAVTGDLDAGDLIADYPLAVVRISGINITSVENTFNAGWLSLPQTRQNINFIGASPISSVDEDTPANWAALGTGIAYYNTLGQIIDQPTQYGTIQSFVCNDAVFQTWNTVNGIWYRRGNNIGWSSSWVKMLDEKTGIQIKKLWQNASPTSSFAAQSIPITDFNNYDFFIVVAWGTATSYTTGILSAAYGGMLQLQTAIPQSGFAPMIRNRAFSSDTTNKCISVGEGRQQRTNTTTMTTSNSDQIPYRIYGIKGVL